MESLLWSLRSYADFQIAWPIALGMALSILVVQHDFYLLLARFLARAAFGRSDGFAPRGPGERPSGIVIIPALLRGPDDFKAITTTVESSATNGYPGELLVVASVDGRTEKPALYRELRAWIAAQKYPRNVRVELTGTDVREGKMMAVEAGVTHAKRLVARGELAKFPDVYFSIDGDGTLGPHALERLAHELARRHFWTGNRRHVVSGKICIRPDLIWQGWRAFFTVAGQIYAQVGREFLVSNVARHNWKVMPMMGIPGALYCTWSEVLLEAPRYMRFMQGLRIVDWLKWWVGCAPPKFSESDAAPLPEALTGASDDTCIAFLASIAHWKDGRLSFDAPRTPLHAFGRLLFAYLVERSHQYEPEARVWTYTPATVKGLWRQRVRWNSSRFECAGRFWRSFLYHWELGFPTSTHLLHVIDVVLNVSLYYVVLPYYVLGKPQAVFAYVIGYACQTISYTLYSLMALAMERDYRRCWRALFALPLAPIYVIVVNFFGCVNGVVRDLVLFGNWTNFAPEETLMKGNCERVALLFRARRFLTLALRSVLHGDVPFGAFWLGWTETPWTPSGFEGWTTGKKPRPILPRPLFGAPSARAAEARAPDNVVPIGERRGGTPEHELAETKRAA